MENFSLCDCGPHWEIVEGGHWKRNIPLYGRSARGTWRGGGSFSEDPEGYVEKALETGISIGAPLWDMERGSFTRVCGVTRLGEVWLATSWPTAWVKVLRLCFPMNNDTDLFEAAVTLVVVVKYS